MVGLLGNFPPQLLARGRFSSQYFDSKGQGYLAPLYSDLIMLRGHLLKMDPTYNTSLATLLLKLEEKCPQIEITQAADFLSKTLVIDPQQRWSADQLLQHPWVKE